MIAVKLDFFHIFQIITSGLWAGKVMLHRVKNDGDAEKTRPDSFLTVDDREETGKTLGQGKLIKCGLNCDILNMFLLSPIYPLSLLTVHRTKGQSYGL